MSFIITTYCNEGIVMASDSRITYNNTSKGQNDEIINNVGINLSDNVNKLFLTKNGIGISACGTAAILNFETNIAEPISGHVEKIINEEIFEEDKVDIVVEKIIRYFDKFNNNLDTTFHVAGYDKEFNRKIVRFNLATGKREDFGKEIAGATWDGETIYFSKLFNETEVNGNNKFVFPQLDIPFQFFNLQDAIDFCRFAIDITIKTMRFTNVVKTVGGNIDVLVIKPDEEIWVSKKELH
ncbi:MAG: hypothetical protein WAO56_05385 [Miniphocaeibacter sp.]|uniref:hypothetical protein n=1 Tax=Miniphocaeibacter sp. TaxID=3100973 RepID=UPI0017A3B8ED|nr:hypothetical protein [Gallicola sp.]